MRARHARARRARHRCRRAGVRRGPMSHARAYISVPLFLRTSSADVASSFVNVGRRLILAAALASAVACGETMEVEELDAGFPAADSGATATACALAENTLPSGVTSPSGCDVLLRDTGACEAERRAAGLDGFWLRFSCRVDMTVAEINGATYVVL